MLTGHTGKTHVSQTPHHPLSFDFVASWTCEHCQIFCFPRSDRSAPPRAVPRAVRAVRLDKDSVRRPCHSGMSDFQALMASYLMTDYLTYPHVSPPTPNNKLAVKAAHTCTDMQVRWPIPAQDGSVQSGKLHHDQKKSYHLQSTQEDHDFYMNHCDAFWTARRCFSVWVCLYSLFPALNVCWYEAVSKVHRVPLIADWNYCSLDLFCLNSTWVSVLKIFHCWF